MKVGLRFRGLLWFVFHAGIEWVCSFFVVDIKDDNISNEISTMIIVTFGKDDHDDRDILNG